MARFLDLDLQERGSALSVAAESAARDAHLLEKDVWVVWTLDTLFRSRFGPHLVFKGGTSLSKVHRAIDRFSEDVDVTYDIRELVPAAQDSDAREPLPPNNSQARRWREQVDTGLPAWVRDQVAPILRQALDEQGLAATIEVEKANVEIHYESSTSPHPYVKQRVLIEFGGRSTGEPCDEHDVGCDAEGHVEGVSFPTARPRTMRAERTFWEKATAVHAYCLGGLLKGDAKARHWLDLHHLDKAGTAAKAAEDRDLAQQVAAHKSTFFKVNTPDGPIDYHAAVNGALQLVPHDQTVRTELADDYSRMVDARLPHGEQAPTFEELMKSCARIAEAVNAAGARSVP